MDSSLLSAALDSLVCRGAELGATFDMSILWTFSIFISCLPSPLCLYYFVSAL